MWTRARQHLAVGSYVLAGFVTFVVFALCLSWILLIDNPLTIPNIGLVDTKRRADLLRLTQNETLGFGAIHAINLPKQPEKWESLTAAAEASGLHFERIDGIDPADIDYDTLPPGREVQHSKLRGYSLGAWRAHMNALEQIIDSGVSTAVVTEDDIDWDVRVKSQMKDLASALQTLVQPLQAPLFVTPPTLATQTDFEDMPATEMPQSGSPYGDQWDVIWLGYCRMLRETHVTEKNHTVFKADDGVPGRIWLDQHGFDGPAHHAILHEYPQHTRLYHHVRDGLCSLFYAVTAEGAKKIHHEFSEVLLYSPFDIMLMDYCNLGARPDPGSKKSLRCFSASPQIFNHWLPWKNHTQNIRWSVRVNIDKLRDGEKDGFIDSWPDEVPLDT